MYKLLKAACAITTIFGIMGAINERENSFEGQVASLVLNLPTVVGLWIICLAMRCKLASADYSVIFLVAVRCICTFLIVHLQQSKASGFAEVDLKELNEYVTLTASCLFATAICNLKLDLLVTAPMVFISIFLINQPDFTITHVDQDSCKSENQSSPGVIVRR